MSAQSLQDSFKQLPVFGMQEAIVADFDEGVGQDMLEEAGEEDQRRQRESFEMACFAVPELETDAAVFEAEEAAVGEGDAVEVRGEVLENRLALTGGAAIDHPIVFPDAGGSQRKEVGLFQGVTELGAEDGGESLGGQEEVFFGKAPATLWGEATARDEAVNMRMVAQIPSPGVEHGHHANLPSQEVRITGQRA